MTKSISDVAIVGAGPCGPSALARFVEYGEPFAARHVPVVEPRVRVPRGTRLLPGAVQPARLSAAVPSPALVPEKQSEVLS